MRRVGIAAVTLVVVLGGGFLAFKDQIAIASLPLVHAMAERKRELPEQS